MKRIIFTILMSVILVIGVTAQKKYVKQAEIHIDKKELKEAKTKLDMAFQDEKSKDWAKTYYVFGRLAQEAGSSDNEEFNKLFDNPFKIAYKNYLKAIELDDNMKNAVNMQLPLLSNAVINKGIGGFQTKDYAVALEAFEFAIKIGENEIFGGAADTSIIYNAGLAAYNGEVYDKAIKHFVSCKELGYGGADLYLLLKNCYLENVDSTNAAKILQDAFEAFPGNESVLVHLVNYYLLSGKNEQALEYIAIAKEKDPENATYYHAEGVLYDKAEKPEKAMKAYLKAAELDPTYFNTQYNIGALLFNKGVTMVEKANTIMDNEEYEKAKAAAEAQFAKALPYMEKAHELMPDDIATMETLKILYYRMQMMEKHAVIVKKLSEAKGAE
ncbi:MAG: tetratricopeptide repeat protein [Bacteroidales bacterium]|nr:tetratricopeptide repeat protein [Bacteroidales bacterium]